MDKMNDFEKICKNLNERKTCNNHMCKVTNEYICAKRAVEMYVNGDKNRLSKLKGEMIVSDWWEFVSNLLSIISMVVAVLTLLYTVVCQATAIDKKIIVIYGYILLTSVIFFLSILYRKMKKYQGVAKWKGYVQVAIENLDEEL